MLIAIVLISTMNVMIMAVYEWTREIGTVSAIGTQPNRIINLFLTEGFLLGLPGSIVSIIISLITCFKYIQTYLFLWATRKPGADTHYWILWCAICWFGRYRRGNNCQRTTAGLSPEIVYTGIINFELRLKAIYLIGARLTDFGEK